jgi:hypothetical protein
MNNFGEFLAVVEMEKDGAGPHPIVKGSKRKSVLDLLKSFLQPIGCSIYKIK